jgi:replicative DNA helicase
MLFAGRSNANGLFNSYALRRTASFLLNGGFEARTGIPPTAADLRESGQIEQDADAIILLAQNVTTKKRPEPHYHFALEKNKEGNVGSLDITFQMETQQFKECVWM